jgi:hypothetical protein
MLRIALERPYENFHSIIDQAIPMWKNGPKYHFLNANPSRYMFLASDASSQYLELCFPIMRMSIGLKVACIVELASH